MYVAVHYLATSCYNCYNKTCFRGLSQSAACTSPVLFFYCIQIQYNSQAVTALSRNSMEQGERDDGDRGPGGNLADDDVKGRV